ncbi:hypothetical protein B0T14DRAFT_570741 [Immersiella caudata]|uniref:F-box domain-containing protein n=1 Tax=Immersiella caudata TaxID=314043 RepID=A0AA39WCP7_9PEZI|nr:hypothetical protein B0T14DRAFT_570741 [Immersiella caudata]
MGLLEDEVSTPAALLNLPNELLFKIISMATEVERPSLGWGWWEPGLYDGIDFPLALSLTQVCQRLRPIAIPRLYERLRIGHSNDYHIDLEKDHGLSRENSLQLLRSVEEDPSLGVHCRALELYLVGNLRKASADRVPYELVSSDEKAELAVDVIRAFPKIKRFKIIEEVQQHLEAQAKTWEILRTAARLLPELEEVGFLGGGKATLGEIREVLGGISALKTLSISHCILPSPGNRVDLGDCETQFASLATLDILGFPGQPTDLQYFLHGPKLERFSFNLSYPDGEESANSSRRPWSLPHVFSLFSAQRETLRNIQIGSFYNGNCDLRGLNLAGFTSLEELDLTVRNTGVEAGQKEILTAPRLRKFTWDFQTDDQQVGPHLDDFAGDEEAWLRKFMQAAVALKSPLQEIHVRFRPDIWYLKPDVWPWSRMDGLNREGQELRVPITVTYAPPTVSEEEFEDVLTESPEKT